jgi:hypothetical protein
MRIAILLCPLLAAGLVCQEPDFDALDRELSFRLAADGALELAPDPFSGTDDLEQFRAVVEFGDTLANAGALGYLGFLCHGDADVGSLADGAAILRRLGRGGDAELLQAIAKGRDGSREAQLQALLAIRVVQDRGLKPAIPQLDLVAAAKSAPPHLRRASTEALATLRGTTAAPVWTGPMPPVRAWPGFPTMSAWSSGSTSNACRRRARCCDGRARSASA